MKIIQKNGHVTFFFLFIAFMFTLGFWSYWPKGEKIIQENEIIIEPSMPFDSLPIYTACHDGIVISAKQLDKKAKAL